MPSLPSYNAYLAGLLVPGDYYSADKIGQFCSVVRRHKGHSREEAAPKLDVSVTKLSRTEGGDLRYTRVAQKAFRFYADLRLSGPFARIIHLGVLTQRDEEDHEGRKGKSRLKIVADMIDSSDVDPVTEADFAVVKSLQNVEYVPLSTLPAIARLAVFSECCRGEQSDTGSRQDVLDGEFSKALEQVEGRPEISSPEVLMEALYGDGSFAEPCKVVARTLGVKFRDGLFYRLEDSPQAHSFVASLKETAE